MTTWYVYLKSGAISEVTAEKVKTATDPILGDKVVQFWNGNIEVVQWPEIEIVKYTTTEPKEAKSMKKIIIALGMVVSLACAGAAQQGTGTDLQGRPVQGPRAIETLEENRALGGRAPTPNQSFLVKQQQYILAACMSSFIHELSNTSNWVQAAWAHQSAVVSNPAGWRKTNQFFYLIPHQGHVSWPKITFTNARWDPQNSTMDYGPKQLAQNVEVDNQAKTKLIQNDSDAIVGVSYTESEELTNSFSSSVTKGVTLDMTVTSETTVSGEYAGVSAEEKVTAEFGAETSTEESKEKSQEGTKAEELGIEFDAEPGQYYLVTISKEHKTTYQDFRITGVMDYDIEIDLTGNRGGRLGSHYPGNKITVTGISGFEQFVRGYDTNYPAMVGFYDASYTRTKNGINCVIDANRRRISVSGTNQASLESNADYRVESLGNAIPPNLAHLPIVKAADLTDGGRQ